MGFPQNNETMQYGCFLCLLNNQHFAELCFRCLLYILKMCCFFLPWLVFIRPRNENFLVGTCIANSC